MGKAKTGSTTNTIIYQTRSENGKEQASLKTFLIKLEYKILPDLLILNTYDGLISDPGQERRGFCFSL